MLQQVEASLPVDIAIFAAAVADWRVANAGEQKLKKTGSGMPPLQLVENPDILKEAGRQKGDRILVGFAVESDAPRQGALDKLRRKNLDLIVLNAPTAFGADVTSVDIIDRHERTVSLRDVAKQDVAREILREVETLSLCRQPGSGDVNAED